MSIFIFLVVSVASNKISAINSVNMYSNADACDGSLIFVYFKFYISIEFILFFGSNKIVAPAQSLYGDMLLPSL